MFMPYPPYSVGRGTLPKPLPPDPAHSVDGSGGRNAGAFRALFFSWPKSCHLGREKKRALARPSLQKWPFRRGEMAVLLVSGSWPGLRIGPKTAAQNEAKMRPKIAKIKAKRRLTIFCQDQLYTRVQKWHQKIGLTFFGGAQDRRRVARDRPKIGVVTFFGGGF